MVGVVLWMRISPTSSDYLSIWSLVGGVVWGCLGGVACLRKTSLGMGFGSRKSCLFPICSFCLVFMVKDVNSQHPCSCHLSKQTLPLWLTLAVAFYQSNREQIEFFPPSGMGKAILTILDNYRNEQKSKHAEHKNQGSPWRERYTSTGLE